MDTRWLGWYFHITLRILVKLPMKQAAEFKADAKSEFSESSITDKTGDAASYLGAVALNIKLVHFD